MTKTCAYCGTPVKFKTVDEGNGTKVAASCDFCKMDLNTETEVLEDGNRNLKSVPPIVDLSMIHKPTKSIMQLSVYELLCLLKEVNRERSDMYDNLTKAKKWKEEVAPEDLITLETINTTIQTIAEEYEYFSRKKWIIENILVSRIDLLPSRLTDKYLHDYWENSLKMNKRLRPMGFKKAE